MRSVGVGYSGFLYSYLRGRENGNVAIQDLTPKVVPPPAVTDPDNALEVWRMSLQMDFGCWHMAKQVVDPVVTA